MKIIFLGKIKFYDDTTEKIKLAIDNTLKNFDEKSLDFDLVFEWNEIEGCVFWDIYGDIIRFGIPLSQKIETEILESKLKRALIQKIN